MKHEDARTHSPEVGSEPNLVSLRIQHRGQRFFQKVRRFFPELDRARVPVLGALVRDISYRPMTRLYCAAFVCIRPRDVGFRPIVPCPFVVQSEGFGGERNTNPFTGGGGVQERRREGTALHKRGTSAEGWEAARTPRPGRHRGAAPHLFKDHSAVRRPHESPISTTSHRPKPGFLSASQTDSEQAHLPPVGRFPSSIQNPWVSRRKPRSPKQSHLDGQVDSRPRAIPSQHWQSAISSQRQTRTIGI